MGAIIKLLIDISNAAETGIQIGTEDAAQAALEKIHAAIASALPVDQGGTTAPRGCGASTARGGAVATEYRTPQHVLDFVAKVANVPFTDMADPELLKRISETHRLVPLKSKPKMKADKRVAATPQTIVFETTLAHGRKLSAQWSSESTSSNAATELWDGDNHVAEIVFFTKYQGRSWGRKITQHALKGLASKAGHHMRNRRNKKEVA